MRNALILVLIFTAHTRADDVKVVLWNSDTLFDAAAINRRVYDLHAFGKHYRDADIVILNEVTSLKVVDAVRDKMGLVGFHTACSDFSQNDQDTYRSLEVGIISRFPMSDIVEFDVTPDNTGRPGEPSEEQVKDVGVADITNIDDAKGIRGFLTADIPVLGLTLAVTHLKSSRGSAGPGDLNNSKLREYVAAAIAQFVVGRIKSDPKTTVLVAGDMNVGETDSTKLGTRLQEDCYRRTTGDLYDETHAIFSTGLVNGLKMRSLTKTMGAETYDSPRFAGAGPIDCIYVAGERASHFTPAKKCPDTFGSDHFAVSTYFRFPGKLPSHPKDRPIANVAPPPPPSPADPGIQISALLPNPSGQDAGMEWVKITNCATKLVNLDGWQLRDKADNLVSLKGKMSPGAERTIRLEPDQMPLNNSGDTVELLNAKGQIVHRVRYNKSQVTVGRAIHFSE